MNRTKITDIETPVVVGEVYFVPFYPSLDGVMIPVLLPAHEDSKLFNFNHYHYHIDERFVSESFVTKHFPNDVNNDAYFLITTKNNKPDYERIEWKFAVCVRDFPKKTYNWAHERLVMRSDYAKPRDYCGRCPHKGANLNQVEEGINGVKVCPMHGGKWKIRDEKISLVVDEINLDLHKIFDKLRV